MSQSHVKCVEKSLIFMKNNLIIGEYGQYTT